MIETLQNHGYELIIAIGEHILIALVSLILAIIVAVPLGIILTRLPKLSNIIIGMASILQTIPTLALLALMIPLFGIGRLPAIVALFIYSLLPILRNTFIGVDEVDLNIIDAAKGMGMTNIQLIFNVELPMAMPVIMAGIRLAGVYAVAWATLASYIGAGGLGTFIFNGLTLYQVDMILMGTIPVTILALLVDYILGKLEVYLSPRTSSNE